MRNTTIVLGRTKSGKTDTINNISRLAYRVTWNQLRKSRQDAYYAY